MKIKGREISPSQPPYLIAEIGGNHAGNLAYAKALIGAAKSAGADACKLQCFEAGRITLNCDKPDFILKDGPWKGRKLYDLYAATQTPRDWFPALFDHAKQIGITIFSSVFSPEDIDFLETLECPAYKIASMEITDIGLIEYAAKTGKPIIISTGMAEWQEIKEAFDAVAYIRGPRNIHGHVKGAFWLHCISGYPTPIEEAALGALREIKDFGGRFGISDHSLGVDIPIAATVLGATLIEKHLRLENVESEDSAFSMTPVAFEVMCRRVRAIWRAMQPSERKSEESSRQARRSLYVVKDIKSGERFTTENVRSIRPAYGMPPKELPRVLESFATCDIECGTALEEGHLLPF